MKWEATQTARILIVDDNPMIHEDFDLVFLTRRGKPEPEADRFKIYEQAEAPVISRPAYELDHAMSGVEAVEKVTRSAADGRPYQMAFVDIRMPGMDGVETIERIWAIDSRIQSVICTAYADYRWEDLARRLGQSDKLLVLKKPFDQIEVIQLASTLTEKWFLARQADLKFEQMEVLVAQRSQRFLDLQRREMQRLQEQDQMKLRFLTSLSQEFRTPLTLILNGLDEMRISETDRPRESLVRRSVERLLSLVEESLNLHQLEGPDFKIQPANADLVTFLQGVMALFKPVAHRQNIQLELQINQTVWPARFDPGMLERILFNLIANALKSTPQGGRISVQVQLTPGTVALVVEDTGVGTPAEELPPTGESARLPRLALAVTQNLAHLLGGTATFESPAPNRGSTAKSPGTRCTICLPLQDIDATSASLSKGTVPGAPAIPNTAPGLDEGAVLKEQPLIVLAENSLELARHIQQGFGSDYCFVHVTEGRQCLSQTRDIVPDVVIAEFDLAGLAGPELCRKLKLDELTSHIPVILLTSGDSEAAQLAALEAGAADYLVKPVKLSLLKARVENLMESRQKLHELFRQAGQIFPRDIAANQSDAQFFRRTMDLVEQQLSDSEFDVEMMARKLAVSRRQLYRKIQAAAGCSPNAYIRTQRLRRAARLLKESNLTVTEITYSVGFSDLKHFRAIFREHFGVLPAEYQKQTTA